MSSTRPSLQRREPVARRGVGLYRVAGFGWRITLILALVVFGLVAVGIFRADPGRNPAPAAYPPAACAAFAALSAALEPLEAAIDAAEAGDARERDAALDEMERQIAAASEPIDALPDWAPGDGFEELLASLLSVELEIGLALRSTVAGATPPPEANPEEEPRGRLAAARELVAQGRDTLESRRLGFDCG